MKNGAQMMTPAGYLGPNNPRLTSLVPAVSPASPQGLYYLEILLLFH